MHVRPEIADDQAAIHAIHTAAFPGPDEAGLVDRLRESGQLVVSLVAESDGQLVGHIAFSPVRLDDVPALITGVGLAPVAVLPEHQRRGIGSALINAGLAACKQAGHSFVVVLGEPEYYARFGFRAAGELGLRSIYTDGEEFRVQELAADVLAPCSGLIRYAPAFDELS